MKLLEQYTDGPSQLGSVVAGLSDEQLDAVPIPGKWSIRLVVCHIADFELVYADRMKRVIAETQPTFFGGDPDTFAAGLAYEQRDIDEELRLIESVRRHVTRILRTLDAKDFERIGLHNEDGPVSLATLLTGVSCHLPHHLAFIEEKLSAMNS
jgi:uncharacterized damage-inducible protein DinB